VLAHAHVRAPLKIVRPFDVGDGRVLVQILHLGPGLCAGDRYGISLTVKSGARAVVIMQAASRVLGMRDGTHASQEVSVNVEAGAHLEYYPGLTIPFADSSFTQRVHVDAAGDARVGILETWGTGRSVRGEHLAFRRLRSRTTLSIDGHLAYADALELEPSRANVAGSGILERHRYIASGFWHNVRLSDAALTPRGDVLTAFGQSTPESVYLRALAKDGAEIAALTTEAVQAVNAAWGLAPIPLRRFTS
jgi:urease accessory protein